VFRKILVALDGSVNAEKALPWAIRYAAPSSTPVVLARVLDRVYPLKGMPFGAEATPAHAYLEGVRDTLSRLGIPTEMVFPSDAVASSLTAVAERSRCNLVVMATRGASPLTRRLVGGVTEQVMRTSSVSVLVVPSHAASSPPPDPRRVLLPVDGVSRLNEVLVWGERFARFHRVPLEMLYVRARGKPLGSTATPGLSELKRSAAHLCGLLRDRGIPASYRVGEGNPAREILKASGPTDLVVMTTHGYRGFKHLVRGSVAEKVIHGATGPVFISKTRSRAADARPSASSEKGRPPRATNSGSRRSYRRSKGS
jgi:nucleotide-binding universal stress UspA family protein